MVFEPDHPGVQTLADAHAAIHGDHPGTYYGQGTYDAGGPCALGVPAVMYGVGGGSASTDTFTFSHGAQKALGQGDWRIGGAIGMTQSATSGSSGDSSDATNFHAGLSLKYAPGPYVLAAGRERSADEDARIGVHQHYFGENTLLPAFTAVSDIQRGQGLVMRYLDEMGIDLRLMEPALMTPPKEIYLLTREELRDFNLLTATE